MGAPGPLNVGPDVPHDARVLDFYLGLFPDLPAFVGGSTVGLSLSAAWIWPVYSPLAISLGVSTSGLAVDACRGVTLASIT